MKWETYKLLTEEEKEEYKFKFGTEWGLAISSNFIKVYGIILAFIWIFFDTAFSYFNLINYEITEEIALSFGKGFYGIINLTYILLIIWVFLFILDIVIWLLILKTKEIKWLDERLYIEIIDGKAISKRKLDKEDKK